MKIHKSISHLTGKEQHDLRFITKRIVENIQPQMLLCYGSRVQHAMARSCLTETRKREYSQYDYDLFIVISEKEPLDEATVSNLAGRFTQKDLQANYIVHRHCWIQEELSKGSFFVSRLLKSSILLHNKDGTLEKLLSPAVKASKMVVPDSLYTQYKHLFDYAGNLIRKAEEHVQAHQPEQVLIQLRQALSANLRALIVIGTGYSMPGSDLSRMLHFTRNFTDLPAAFLCEHTAEEKYLKGLLVNGITFNVKENDTVGMAEMIILLDRMKQLRQSVNDYLFKNPTLLKHSQSMPVM